MTTLITLGAYLRSRKDLLPFALKFRAYANRLASEGKIYREEGLSNDRHKYFYRESDLDRVADYYNLKAGKADTAQQENARGFALTRISAPAVYYAYNKLVLAAEEVYYNVFKLQGVELHKVATFLAEEEAQDYCINANRRGIDAHV